MRKCPYCGAEYSDEVALCPIDHYALDGTEMVSVPENPVSAGFWIRLVARLADTVFGMFIGLAAGHVAFSVILLLNAFGMLAPDWQEHIHDLSLASIGLAVIGSMAYHIFCEGLHGATLGKLCCGIRVVSEDLTPSQLKGAIIRNLAFFLDAQAFGMVGFSSMSRSSLNQRYGDRWGKTAVVKVNRMAPESRATTRSFILCLLVGAGSWLLLLVMGEVCKVI